ncbi:MAG: MATE family efflux transporter [Oscillospiraceae bacterium]|nr:MATE family efflux transporter [Candidatus Limimonas egerieequi]
MNIRKYFGDKAFYKYVLGLSVPIMIQNFITNFVSMLDNLMVGNLGTAQMSGVSVSNQLLFVFQLTVFGLVSGAGIFGAQYAGNKDVQGLRNTFKFKIIASLIFTFCFCWVYAVANEALIGLYLKGDGDPTLAVETVKNAKAYLIIMLVGLYPTAVSQAYASSLREVGQTKVPMYASLAAVVFNVVFDYILIYGKFGAPRLEVRGAAIATVLARFLELAILIIWSNRNKAKDLYAFIQGAWKPSKIPLELVKNIIIKGTPLMLNEALWSAGITRLAQCYSMRDLNVVPAMSISTTYFNLFSVLFVSMGVAIGIIIGQKLGANDTDDIMLVTWRLILFSLIMSLICAILFILCSLFIPNLYATTREVRHMATIFMIISASGMLGDSVCNSTYFTIRSGGNTLITFLMDSGFVWCVCVATATILINFTTLSVYLIYFIIQLCNYLKAAIGFTLVKKGIWINNIIQE